MVTSLAHNHFVRSNMASFWKLESAATCFGQGVELRKKHFGYGEESPAIKDFPCLIDEVRPCSLCDRQVCDVSQASPFRSMIITDDAKNCRFHFLYDSKNTGEETESKYADDLQENLGDGAVNIESTMAAEMYLSPQRLRDYCLECHPMVSPQSPDFLFCGCSLYDVFVGRRWLCLPCFFLESAKIQAHRHSKLYHTCHPGGLGPIPSEDQCIDVSLMQSCKCVETDRDVGGNMRLWRASYGRFLYVLSILRRLCML